MMKKRIWSMLMVLVLLSSLLSTAAFAEGETHEHKWSSDWTSQNGYHWHECDAEGCDVTEDSQKNGYALCVDENSDHKCDNCDTTMHSWKTSWTKDDTNHWHPCAGCNEVRDMAAHDWKVDSSVSNTTTIVSKCSVCGETKTENHEHTYAADWSYDKTNHWHAATCGHNVVSGQEAHFDNNGNKLCDGCGFDMNKVNKTLTITDLSAPKEGTAVDFSATVSPSDEYSSVKVYWNRSADLSKGSEELSEGATYAADYMYTVGILVKPADGYTVSPDLAISLNGETVKLSSQTEAEAQMKLYDGSENISVAYVNSNGYIMVGMMYTEVGGTHTHTYTTGDNWTESDTQHWHVCTGCGATKDVANHYDNNGNSICDVCGHKVIHTHSYSSDWIESATQHWHQCTTCGATKDTANHADLNNTGKCDVCGFVMTAAAGHTHAFATDWTETFAQHYKLCSCGAKTEIAAHVDANNTHLCDVCGYAMTTSSTAGVVDTGDDNATFLWIAAMFVSVFGVAATAVYTKKRRAE